MIKFSKLWLDTSFLKLSANAKYLYIYLCTSPRLSMALTGSFILPYIVLDTGLSDDAIKSALTELDGLVIYDDDTSEYIIPSMAQYMWTASPKLNKPISAAISAIKSELILNIALELADNRINSGNKSSVGLLNSCYIN